MCASVCMLELLQRKNMGLTIGSDLWSLPATLSLSCLKKHVACMV